MRFPTYPYWTSKGAQRAQERFGGMETIEILEFNSGRHDRYFLLRRRP